MTRNYKVHRVKPNYVDGNHWNDTQPKKEIVTDIHGKLQVVIDKKKCKIEKVSFISGASE